MRHVQAQLLDGLSPGGHGRRLPGVDVAAGLHPAGETLVQMQDRAPAADDDGRRGDVHGVGLLVERIVEAIELGQEAVLGRDLTGSKRHVGDHAARSCTVDATMWLSITGGP